MPRPRKTERKQILSNTRQQLLDAATAEFADHGYVGANINRISQAAGFAKGTIYNYFSSKRALMLALIDEIAAAHADFILQAVEPEESPIRRLERFFSAGTAFVEQNPTQVRLIINIIYGPDDEFEERVYQAYEPLFTMVTQGIVEAGINRGDFRPADPLVVTSLIMSIYLGSSSQLDADGKIWLDLDQIVGLVLDGLCSREHPLKDKG